MGFFYCNWCHLGENLSWDLNQSHRIQTDDLHADPAKMESKFKHENEEITIQDANTGWGNSGSIGCDGKSETWDKEIKEVSIRVTWYYKQSFTLHPTHPMQKFRMEAIERDSFEQNDFTQGVHLIFKIKND